jgi:probable HAF family extracellular repeat protein
MKMSKLTFAVVLLLATAPLALAQGTYTQIDVPGAQSTVVQGVDSNGDLAGAYYDSNGTPHGFLLSGGVYTTIDDPGVPDGTAWGINDVGQMVGNNGSSSYLYDVQTATFTPIAFPNAKAGTKAFAINNAGTIVGAVERNGGCCLGFELKNGSYQTVVRQGSGYTQLYGINNLGTAVGIDIVNGAPYSFLYINGRSQTLRIPGKLAAALGINDHGALVGSYYPAGASNPQGFLYQDGILQEIAFPGSTYGAAGGINNSGEIVGFFIGTDQNTHGFTWTHPADAAKK